MKWPFSASTRERTEYFNFLLTIKWFNSFLVECFIKLTLRLNLPIGIGELSGVSSSFLRVKRVKEEEVEVEIEEKRKRNKWKIIFVVPACFNLKYLHSSLTLQKITIHAWFIKPLKQAAICVTLGFKLNLSSAISVLCTPNLLYY